MFEAVLFDFGQTLVDSADGFRTAEKEVQEQICNDLQEHTSESISRESFLPVYRRLRKEFQYQSNFSRKSLWQAVYFHFGHQAEANVLEQWEHDYWRRVTEMTSLFPETLDVLATLRRTYRLGLITNTQGQLRSSSLRLEKFPELACFFEATVVAGEAEVPAKPDPTPFRLCLQQLHVETDKAVFVGDDWHRDVRGAKNAGVRAIWLKHHSVPRNWPQVETDVPIITSLSPLLNLESLFT